MAMHYFAKIRIKVLTQPQATPGAAIRSGCAHSWAVCCAKSEPVQGWRACGAADVVHIGTMFSL